MSRASSFHRTYFSTEQHRNFLKHGSLGRAPHTGTPPSKTFDTLHYPSLRPSAPGVPRCYATTFQWHPTCSSPTPCRCRLFTSLNTRLLRDIVCYTRLPSVAQRELQCLRRLERYDYPCCFVYGEQVAGRARNRAARTKSTIASKESVTITKRRIQSSSNNEHTSGQSFSNLQQQRYEPDFPSNGGPGQNNVRCPVPGVKYTAGTT